MSYLNLVKKIMLEDLSKAELIHCLGIPNIPVIQQTILKIIQYHFKDEAIRIKLIGYCKHLGTEYKLVGLCSLGHLAVYALKRLDYHEDFEKQYHALTEYDKEIVTMLERSLDDINENP